MSSCLLSCSGSRQAVIANKQYAPDQLRKDFLLFRHALEESHPGLYWFTPKMEMDRDFDEAYSSLTDSLTEREFRTLLTKVVADIRCGHTSVSYSRRYSRYLDTAKARLFPLSFKIWEDTLAVTGNFNPDDSLLTRGTVVRSINETPAKILIDSFLQYTTGDGYSRAGRYQSLSSFGNFGLLYKNVIGLPDSFRISYLDYSGNTRNTVVPVFIYGNDSTDRSDSIAQEKYTPRERRNLYAFSTRNLQVDTLLGSAFMTLNTFTRGNNLRKFFRNSFKSIDRLQLKHLVVDVRSNGGGDAGLSTMLTQYIADHRFRIADSLYANKRSTRYRRHVRFQPIYWLMTTIVTRKRNDGKFHFGYFERHYFRPRKKFHFDGNVYILTGGNSFSATTLFAQELKGQSNVKIVGEETGGGGYGNSAWMIPELKLKYTKLRIGIPKFRMVMRKELVAEGRGVMPDLYAAPNIEDIRRGRDVKIEAVKQLIIEKNKISK